ncbi:LIM and calponin homology domains-containing protein 1a isoform X9 [Latimeria chalumnae]|uniref:LIM and calponin homology domains-containing protein 1a isoform X9 n=1 Tax=Latimeria chalumnae TaxID=7897 RepID=UPI0006D8F2B4|nr:PREDICTED: LIM and calponin homology domains-containing protein 1 isoform X8 [Latimeria chalumnae]|eukprot:XP_014346236.1 PREDICTED: LIM and calponin homology domains-containing protein 1 isoform X8 [Latimeria chalumnae]
MASPGLQLEENHHQQDSVLELAFNEAQKWIEQVTGRSFGDKDFRSGLENGILLCELLNAIKPGLVKKINRLPTPIAGLDNISLFLRGCKELGLKESQLFDPSDLQDTSHRLGVRSPDCSRKLKNVLITIYWLGKVANSCASYNGATLNLKEFEGLLAQIKKETEEVDSPKRSIRDSGYIDCWDSERSDSLSPPRHGRDDSFDSLDSFGSRSQQTPSPDVILKGSSDGRGSDSESDMPHRKMLDSRKDDMSARRTSYSEPKTAVPFNQYLPNKSNQTCYMPASLRKKKAEREEYRKSWSTATSPLGGERPFSQNPPETIEEEQYEATLQYEEEGAKHKISKIETSEQVVKFKLDSDLPKGDLRDQSPSDRSNKTLTQKWEGKDEEEIRKLQRLEQAGIKVMPASKRYSSVHQKQTSEEPTTLDIILRRENAFLMYYQGNDLESDEEEHRVPDVEKDDLATRKARMSQFTPKVAFNQFLPVTCTKQDREKWEAIKLASQRAVGSPQKNQRDNRSENQVQASDPTDITRKQNSFFKSHRNDSEKEGEEQQQQVKVPDVLRDDLAKRKAQSSLAIRQELPLFIKGSVTQADLEKWEKLKMSTETSDENSKPRKIGCEVKALPKIEAETAAQNDLASRKARANKKAPGAKQRFVHFGPVTEIDQKRWDKLSIAKAGSEGETEEASSGGAKAYSCGASSVVSQANACSSQHGRREDRLPASHNDSRYGPRTSLSDDAESVSMFDMRCEDEALVQPHSKTRYERIQDVNNQLKEEEERWQDDLARWKTRRRSASQDLIKKEEERKMMEKLMCGEDGLTGRRKSIKTYREIVEEKERRERELHEAYKNARSREEADRILHRYVQRFAISEAVLERLEMPKFFERSQSVESDGSSSSPSKDSNPLKYLRQQSLPAQKFTATVETTIVSSSQPQANSPTNRTSPSKTIVSKAVPVLTPKPYSQPKSSQQSFKSFKVDGKLNVNGETSETFNGVEEKERFPAKVDPSLTRSQMFEGVASVDESRVTEQQSSMCRDTKPAGPGSPCGNKQQPESGIEKPAVSKKPVQEECDSGAELDATKKQTLKAPQDGKHLMDARNLHSSTVVTRLEFAPSKSPKEASPEHKAPADTGNIQDSSSVELVTHEAQKSKTPEQEVESLFEFLKKAPETNQGASQISPVSGEPAELHSGEVQTISVPPLNLPKRLDHWSWNPEEERKRQERWQKEQERLLQERYQREQEKLKEEWERAQKEVEEEERRYHEEERKIIEETVATFTPHSTLSSPSPTDHPSPLTPEESRNSESAALLLGGWENKQEPQKKPLQLAEAETWQIIERQKKDDQQQLPGELERETVLKKEENEHCTEKWSSKTPSYKEPLAQKQNQQDCQIPMLENSSHVKTEFQFTQDMSWNQQSLIKPPQVSQDVRKKTASLDRSWGQQPFVTEGMRRSGSHENLGTAPPYSSALQGQSPNRSVSGKKLCSTCGHPLGKGAAMIIETLSLYFHIQCFKCGICKGQLGDATTGTDVRIRNGLLNCNDCYIRSRTAGQPTTL